MEFQKLDSMPVLIEFRSFCDIFSVYFGALINLYPFHAYLDPYHVYKLVRILIGLNIAK